MQKTKREHERRSALVELGTASIDTRGLPVGDIPEPMGLWRKEGISDE
jgi:hypothetical protein